MQAKSLRCKISISHSLPGKICFFCHNITAKQEEPAKEYFIGTSCEVLETAVLISALVIFIAPVVIGSHILISYEWIIKNELLRMMNRSGEKSLYACTLIKSNNTVPYIGRHSWCFRLGIQRI